MDENTMFNSHRLQSTTKDVNGAQLQYLFERLSTDDRQMLMTEIAKIQKDALLTRTLPITAFGVGCMYYARTKLKIPALLKRKPIQLYVGIGLFSFLSSGFITRPLCRKKLQPIYSNLVEKYKVNEQSEQNISKHGGYEELRRRNRLGNSNLYESPPLASDNYNEMGNVKPYASDSKFNPGLEKEDNVKEAPRMNTDPNRQKNPYAGYNYDSYGYMPGTPIPKFSNENSRNNDGSGKPSYDSPTKNRYGDTDFS
uniref:OCIA domain-containing protein n=1 Tax=Strongyloides papillosus TaxID=174720 RepID=A0A0N5BFR3_STREA